MFLCGTLFYGLGYKSLFRHKESNKFHLVMLHVSVGLISPYLLGMVAVFWGYELPHFDLLFVIPPAIGLVSGYVAWRIT